jgi:hypothetical protein
MRWVITDPRGVDPALADPRPSSPEALKYADRYNEPSRRLLDFVSGHPPLPASERLSIYAEGYFARLLESMTADFGALQAVLGEESFLKLVADYLKAYPSKSANIGEAGERLAAFLATHELGLEHPELVELASLEWAVIESFYADEHPAPARLNPAALQSIPAESWPGASFELDASIRFLAPKSAVERLWYARHDESEVTQAASLLAPSEPGAGLFIFRNPHGHVDVERIGVAQLVVLRAMARGSTLTEICELLEPDSDGGFPPLMQWFSGWVACGVISSIRYSG